MERVKEDAEKEKPSRRCTECGKSMSEGYCIDGGADYYCSSECLHKNMTEAEYEEAYDNGESETYWTTWED